MTTVKHGTIHSKLNNIPSISVVKEYHIELFRYYLQSCENKVYHVFSPRIP